jgi:hypothetical protein
LTSDNIELTKLLLNVTSPALILLGWYFIRLNTHKFAVRAEMNAVAKEIITITNEMLIISTEYWLKKEVGSNQSNFSYQTLILNHLNRLLPKKAILENYNPNFKLIKIKELKQSLTLNSRGKVMSENEVYFSKIVSVITTVNNQIDSFIAIEKKNSFAQLINQYPVRTGQILGGVACLVYSSLFMLFF